MLGRLCRSGVSESWQVDFDSDMNEKSIKLEFPAGKIREFTHLVLDYTGTLSLDGMLLPGVTERLAGIAGQLQVTVLTADTFGTCAEQLKGLPVNVHIMRTGFEKVDVVNGIGGEQVIAIGNGRNDVPMMKLAALSIAVIGREGAAGELLAVADVVVKDIHDAFDLINYPLRLKATLRD